MLAVDPKVLKEAAKTKRLSLAYRELPEVVEDGVLAKLYDTLEWLDLSHNAIVDLRGIMKFRCLKTLVLDNNSLTNRVKLPFFAMLDTLWVNHNQISNLAVFMENVASAAPQLRHLSMLDNPCAPSFMNEGTVESYQDFRYFVISSLPKLLSLDGVTVSAEERAQATKLYRVRFQKK